MRVYLFIWTCDDWKYEEPEVEVYENLEDLLIREESFLDDLYQDSDEYDEDWDLEDKQEFYNEDSYTPNDTKYWATSEKVR